MMAAAPLLLVALSAGTAVAGGVMAFQQGRFQAKVAEQNAEIAREKGQIQARRAKASQGQRISLARAQIGAAGIAFAGTPLDLLAGDAAQGAADVQLIRAGASIQSVNFLARAAAAKQQAIAGLIGGIGGAGTSILTGVSDAQVAQQQTDLNQQTRDDLF